MLIISSWSDNYRITRASSINPRLNRRLIGGDVNCCGYTDIGREEKTEYNARIAHDPLHLDQNICLNRLNCLAASLAASRCLP